MDIPPPLLSSLSLPSLSKFSLSFCPALYLSNFPHPLLPTMIVFPPFSPPFSRNLFLHLLSPLTLLLISPLTPSSSQIMYPVSLPPFLNLPLLCPCPLYFSSPSNNLPFLLPLPLLKSLPSTVQPILFLRVP